VVFLDGKPNKTQFLEVYAVFPGFKTFFAFFMISKTEKPNFLGAALSRASGSIAGLP
jgi:hypothetical protein